MRSRKKVSDSLQQKMIAHELIAPIGSISAAASLLANGECGKLPPAALGIIKTIEEISDNLINHAESYIAVLQIQNNTFRSNPGRVKIKKLLESILKNYLPKAQIRKNQISLICAQLPSELCLDQNIITHVVSNLIDNAIKYTKNGTIKINAAWANDSLCLAVSDTGQGMSAKVRASLFIEPIQSTQKKVNSHSGMGLGLYLVSSLLRAANGKISAKSPGANKGSTFIVHLPAPKVDSALTAR